MKNCRRTLLLLTALLLALSSVGCGGHKAPLYADLDFSAVDAAKCTETEEVTDLVKLSVENFGDVIIRLYPDVAPETVENFQKLVSEKFYDGLTFHRVYSGFMIQGGDPDGDGTGGSPDTIKGEFSANGFENNLKHVRGVVSMARRSNDMNSASSQFFIMHKTTSSLDGQYGAFGYVVSGMDVVDAIAATPVKANSSGEKTSPVTPVVITSARFVKVAE